MSGHSAEAWLRYAEANGYGVAEAPVPAAEAPTAVLELPDTWRIDEGDCLEAMRALPDACVDAVVTDPPYEIGFMGKTWDSTGVAYSVETWAECLRVLRPGGHLLAFSATRTYHRMACAIEDAGFEIRDMVEWIYGTGFPKSKNLDGDWQGWGTALKPAHEPIVLARRPLAGTVAANVLEHGTGALNVDGCRVGAEGGGTHCTNRDAEGRCLGHANAGRSTSGETFHGPESASPEGRWPANLILGPTSAANLDESSPETASRKGRPRGSAEPGDGWGMTATGAEYEDSGGPSRFFYVAKPSRRERDAGLGDEFKEGHAGPQRANMALPLVTKPRKNTHPTVKPVALMRYLTRLVTPPGGIVLDPFAGSGSTGMGAVSEGFRFLGLEIDPDHCAIARARIAHHEEA